MIVIFRWCVCMTMLSNSLADIVQYVSQVLEIARSVTNQTSNDTAKELFIKRLNESDMYFVDKPIPANESDENAHVLCSSVEGAKKYCPNRWKAMQNWFAEARKVKKWNIKICKLQTTTTMLPFFPFFLFLCLHHFYSLSFFFTFSPFSSTLGTLLLSSKDSSPLFQPLLHCSSRSFPFGLPRLCLWRFCF